MTMTGKRPQSGKVIANCLLKAHSKSEKRSHIDERSQQLFASKRSAYAQKDCIPANTAAEKSRSASIFLRNSVFAIFIGFEVEITGKILKKLLIFSKNIIEIIRLQYYFSKN